MTARHETVEDYQREIAANRRNLTPPKDGAIFYTTGARTEAEALAQARRDAGDPAVTLEQTEYGRKLDGDNLYSRRDPGARAFNERAAREGHEGGKFAGADATWRDCSRTYAEQAEGRVEVVVGRDRDTGKPKIHDGSVFAREERDALLKNEKVTEINGLDRRQLAELKPEQVNTYVERSSMAREKNDREKMQELQQELQRDARLAKEKAQGVEAPDPAKGASPEGPKSMRDKLAARDRDRPAPEAARVAEAGAPEKEAPRSMRDRVSEKRAGAEAPDPQARKDRGHVR